MVLLKHGLITSLQYLTSRILPFRRGQDALMQLQGHFLIERLPTAPAFSPVSSVPAAHSCQVFRGPGSPSCLWGLVHSSPLAHNMPFSHVSPGLSSRESHGKYYNFLKRPPWSPDLVRPPGWCSCSKPARPMTVTPQSGVPLTSLWFREASPGLSRAAPRARPRGAGPDGPSASTCRINEHVVESQSLVPHLLTLGSRFSSTFFRCLMDPSPRPN